jgi:hypothetical protein
MKLVRNIIFPIPKKLKVTTTGKKRGVEAEQFYHRQHYLLHGTGSALSLGMYGEYVISITQKF